MNTLTIIILAVSAVLLIIGATQRQQIKLWFKSEVNDIVTKNTNNVKVAKYQVKDIRAKVKTIINQAGELFALEETQTKALESLQKQIIAESEAAKVAKDADKKDLALTKLSMIKVLKEQVEIIENNIKVAKESRIKLETKITKLKNKINTYDIQLAGLAARKSTNEVLSSINADSTDGTNIDETINIVGSKVESEEIKLGYIMSESDEDEELTTAEIESAYQEL